MFQLVCAVIASLLFNTNLLGWWMGLRQAAALGRTAIEKVIVAANSTDPTNEKEWHEQVAKPALALEKTFKLLTSGWSSGLAAYFASSATAFAGRFSMVVNTVYTHGVDRANGDPINTQRDVFNRLMCFVTPIPFLIALDLASTSSKADALLDTRPGLSTDLAATNTWRGWSLGCGR